MSTDDDKLRVSLNAPGLSPESADPVLTMETALAYLRVVQAAAQLTRKDFQFRGVYVEPGSARLATVPSDFRTAKRANRSARKWLTGRELPPKNLELVVDVAKRQISALPSEYSVTAGEGNHLFLVIPRDAQVWTPPNSITTLRARLVQIGGIKNPHARFISAYANDGDSFSVACEEGDAKKLAQSLYSDMEIVLEVRWTRDRKIQSGELREWRVVSDEPPAEAWRRWYRENISEWDEVEDIDQELGRDGP